MSGQKRYWPDGHRQRAKCPKCGKIGMRVMVNKIAWMFTHERVPGPLDSMGVPMRPVCIVAIENSNE